jgi:AcrR family transcriptional regulator
MVRAEHERNQMKRAGEKTRKRGATTVPSRGGTAAAGGDRAGRERWIDGALAALIERGLGGIAVEPIAQALGATKGSFHWHFASRDALVAALLQRWESSATEGVIAELETIADPAARLARLLRAAWDDVGHLRAEAALLAAATAGDPLVAPVVARVVRRRLEYVEALYRALGVPPAESSRMAIVAYGAYLGGVQLAAQGLLDAHAESPRARHAQHETLEAMLIPRARRGPRTRR